MALIQGKQRIINKFKDLSAKHLASGYLNQGFNKNCAFIPYLCAGDPDYQTSLEALKMLPKLGADLIEIGVPFLDPSGDGPIIEMASKRAIASGMTLKKVLQMVSQFREFDQKTPLILMSYFNPILHFGVNKFFNEAIKSGVDGVLIVDLPIEEEAEIAKASKNSDLAVIHLVAPSTNEARIKKIVKNASGFLYTISLMGITGTKTASISENQQNLQKIRNVTNSFDLPIAVGFGIQTPELAKNFAKIGFDAVIVGSALVSALADDWLKDKKLENFKKLVSDFAKAIKG